MSNRIGSVPARITRLSIIAASLAFTKSINPGRSSFQRAAAPADPDRCASRWIGAEGDEVASLLLARFLWASLPLELLATLSPRRAIKRSDRAVPIELDAGGEQDSSVPAGRAAIGSPRR
jgi:hypothetical protein